MSGDRAGINALAPRMVAAYTLTQLSQRIGLPNWQAANHLLNRIKEDKGIDLRSSDNRYHCKIKTGSKASSMARKWSHEGVALLKKVQDGEDYEVALQ